LINGFRSEEKERGMPQFATGLAPEFSGKGTYVYSIKDIVAKYHDVDSAADAVKDLGCQNAWVRIHGRGYIGESNGANLAMMKHFIEALKSRSIAVAGWGWCQGEDPVAEAQLSKQAVEEFGLKAFVADIEQGVNSSHWTTGEIVTYLSTLRKDKSIEALAVTSHGFIDWHEPALLKAAQPYVDAMNPQAYWFESYPLLKMLNAIGAPQHDYPLSNAASYAKLCVDRWSHWYAKPVILTGQAYAADAFTNDKVAKKLDEFAAGFSSWSSIAGLNWWHFGAMTQEMRSTIAKLK
jgi:hypothetical protein